MMLTGKRVEELANERNLSLFKLSKMSGVGYSTLKSARNRGTQLSVDTIECICKSLNITMAEFFSEETDSSTSSMLEGQIVLMMDELGIAEEHTERDNLHSA